MMISWKIWNWLVGQNVMCNLINCGGISKWKKRETNWICWFFLVWKFLLSSIISVNVREFAYFRSNIHIAMNHAQVHSFAKIWKITWIWNKGYKTKFKPYNHKFNMLRGGNQLLLGLDIVMQSGFEFTFQDACAHLGEISEVGRIDVGFRNFCVDLRFFPSHVGRNPEFSQPIPTPSDMFVILERNTTSLQLNTNIFSIGRFAGDKYHMPYKPTKLLETT